MEGYLYKEKKSTVVMDTGTKLQEEQQKKKPQLPKEDPQETKRKELVKKAKLVKEKTIPGKEVPKDQIRQQEKNAGAKVRKARQTGKQALPEHYIAFDKMYSKQRADDRKNMRTVRSALDQYLNHKNTAAEEKYLNRLMDACNSYCSMSFITYLFKDERAKKRLQDVKELRERARELKAELKMKQKVKERRARKKLAEERAAEEENSGKKLSAKKLSSEKAAAKKVSTEKTAVKKAAVKTGSAGKGNAPGANIHREPKDLLQEQKASFMEEVLYFNTLNLGGEEELQLKSSDPAYWFKQKYLLSYQNNLKKEMRGIVRQSLKDNYKKLGVNINPSPEEVEQNLPRELAEITEDERAVVNEYMELVRRGVPRRELDLFYSRKRTEWTNAGKVFSPTLYARFSAMTDAYDEVNRADQGRRDMLADMKREPKPSVRKYGNIKDELQDRGVSCWACSSTVVGNAYADKYADTHGGNFQFGQGDFLNQANVNLSQEARQYAAEDEMNKEQVQEAIALAQTMMTGEGEMGNAYMTADVFLKNLSNTAVRSTQLTIPPDHTLMQDEESRGLLKNALLSKIAHELKASGGPISMLIPGHFVTVIGVENGEVVYRDSTSVHKNAPGAKVDPEHPELTKKAKLDQDWHFTAEDLLTYLSTGRSLQLVSLYHLDDDSMQKLDQEFGINNGNAYYDAEGNLTAEPKHDDDYNLDNPAEMDAILHNLGKEFSKPREKKTGLGLLDFAREVVYLPKNRDCRKNVEQNLPAQDMMGLKHSQAARLLEEKQKEKERIQKELKKQEKEREKDGKKEVKGQLHPSKEVFADYKNRFKNTVSDEARVQKSRNVKSRLYMKNEHQKQFFDVSDQVSSNAYQKIKKAMEGRKVGCDMKTLHELSMFLIGGDDPADAKLDQYLLDCYLGKEKDQKTGKLSGQDVEAALDIMAGRLLGMDEKLFSFENDDQMLKYGPQLELMAGRLAAFERMMQKHPEYMRRMSQENRITLQDQLRRLRAASSYYLSRKELLNDDYYRTHYDHELSMNVDANSSEEQRAVAEKLMKNYILANNLMRINGASLKELQLRGEFHFTTPESQQLFRKAQNAATTQEMRDLLEQSFAKMDYLAKGRQLNVKNLPLTGGTDRNFQAITVGGPQSGQILRPDQAYIRAEVAKRLGITGLSISLHNVMKNMENGGLKLERIISILSSDNTIGWTADELVDMLVGLYAPTVHDNVKDPDSEEGKKLNADFEKSVRQMKRLHLDIVRRVQGTFGSVPGSLSYEDSKALMKHYGAVLADFSCFYQDVSQLMGADLNREFYDPAKNEEDRELRFFSYYLHSFINALKPTAVTEKAATMNNEKPDNLEETMDNLLVSHVESAPSLLVEGMEQSRYITGPAFTKQQKTDYRNRQKERMTTKEYKKFCHRQEIMQGGFETALSYWDPKMLNKVVDPLTRPKVYYGSEILNREKDRMELLEHMKKSPLWKHPEQAEDPVLRQQIQLAKTNAPMMEKVYHAMELRNANHVILDEKGEDSPEYAEAVRTTNEYVATIRITEE